jgi:hypothetical protein
MLAATPKVCRGNPDWNAVSIISSLVLNKATEGGQFFFDLLEYRPDALGQGLHLIRADMVRVDIADHVAKPPVGIKLLTGFR